MPYRFVEPVITTDDDAPPATLLAQPAVYVADALPPQMCRRLAATVLAAHIQGHSWKSRTRYGGGEESGWDVDRQFRSSRNISTSLPGLERAYAIMDTHARKAFPQLGLASDTSLDRVDEQCLIYVPGDHIGDHADDAASYLDEEGALAWHVIKPERHVASVLWLTDCTQDGGGELEFAGGELRYNSLLDVDTGEPLTIRPKAGQVVVFPASAWFRHEVLPVTAGLRLAMTRWWQVVPNEVTTRAGTQRGSVTPVAV